MIASFVVAVQLFGGGGTADNPGGGPGFWSCRGNNPCAFWEFGEAGALPAGLRMNTAQCLEALLFVVVIALGVPSLSMMAHHGRFWAKTAPPMNRLVAMKFANANAPVRLPNRRMQVPQYWQSEF
jgi:hypothetical protein